MFVFYLILCQAQLKEVGLVQNCKTLTLQNLITTIDLLILWKGRLVEDGIEIAFGWEPSRFVFKLHWKVCDHTEDYFTCPWHGFWMSFKGIYNLMDTALSYSVKRP